MEFVLILASLFGGYLIGQYSEKKAIAKWLRSIQGTSAHPVKLFPMHIANRIEKDEHHKDSAVPPKA